MLQCSCDNCDEVSPLEIEGAEKSMQQDFDVNSPFGTFVKCIEDTMGIAEASGCPCTPDKIVNKASCSQSSIPTRDRSMRMEIKMSANKTWSNFKLHLSKEAHDCHKDQGLTARKTFLIVNATNQELLQVQADFRNLTQTLTNDFKQQTQDLSFLMPSGTTPPVC